MPLPALAGHHEVRSLIGNAFRSATLPQSILLHGPRGVGKERLALWTAQLLLCEAAGAEPCGQCRPCRLVLRLEHPDLHWFFPLPRPSASSPEKLREKLEEDRSAELQAWRDNPLHLPDFDKVPAHYVGAIRNLQRLASMRPAVGNRSIFVVGDAELMVPQEASPEAANAFLKLLEEPPGGTTLLLTTSQPGALLPTIRSRVLAIRVGAVPDDEIRDLLVNAAEIDTDRATEIAARSRGSVRRAIGLAQTKSGTQEAESKAGREMLLAALSSDGVARLVAANSQRPAGARATLVDQLESLAEWLRDLMAVAAGAKDHVTDPALLPILGRMADQDGVDPESTIAALDRVDRALDLAQRNVNPQLIVASLLRGMQSDFGTAQGSAS